MALQNVEANITLDLYNHDTTPATVKAIQLDSQTRYVAAMLQNVGVQYDVDSEATIQLIVVRPDNVGVQIPGETFEYGEEGAQSLGPYAELTQVALAVSGKMRGQFKITSGTQILRTEIFAINNGVALDASTDEWADEYDGYNLEEMATSIETNTADIASLEADVSQIKEDFRDLDAEVNGTQSGESVDLAQSATWTDGYFIQWNTGRMVDASSGSFATIPVNNVSHISGYTRGGLETTRGIAFCKADGTWISGDYNAGGSSYDWNYSLDVPSDAEIVKISCTVSYKDGFTCVGTLKGSGGLVDELNNVNNKIGSIDSLNTENKSNLVAAINEVYSKASEEKTPDGYDSLRLDVSGIENAIGYKYDEQFFTFSEKTDGYYWIKSGNEVKKSAVSGMTAYAKVFVPAGTYFCARISGANTFIQNANDPTDIKTRNLLTANTDGSYTIDYDFYIYASHTISDGAEGYWATTTLTGGAPVEGRYNVSDDVSMIENGNTVSYTGSWNQTRLGDFKQGTYWKIKLVSYGQTSAIEFKGLPDATDASTNDTLFTLKAGQEILWSPLKNYEAIRYGANGSCTIEINDCTSIYDKLERKAFYCGANREYTKLIDAISAAEMYMGAILYVDAGTYDLVQEFGDDYFAGIATEAMPGIVLKNRIHIVFSPNSRVVCHYEGNNDKVLTNFSPFNCGQFGFTLENLNLDSSRTRYAIHDERNGGTEQCLSRYINCNVKQDNSQNATWGSYCCIGGGLGANHEVMIENCTFESVARDGTVVHGTVSYHPSNKASTDFACELVVKDNYFVTGTLEISGSRTDAVNDTTVIVTNNSFEYHAANAESGIYYSGNPTYQGSHYNIRSWNNEIRQTA